MELTEAEKLLIHGLKLYGVELEDALGIMLLLNTEQMQDEMMLWMTENRQATTSNLIGKAMDIAATKN